MKPLFDVSVAKGQYDEIKAMPEGMQKSVKYTGEGLALLRSCTKGTTNSGMPKYTGVLASKKEMNFSVWERESAFKYLETGTYIPGETVVYIKYSIDKYGLVIHEMNTDTTRVADEFIEQKYDESTMRNNFLNAITGSRITEKGKKLLFELLHINTNDDFETRFYKEYAAMYYHDNCPMGLLAHTTRCLRIYSTLAKLRYNFLENADVNDLMVIGITLHDIGKIYEMNNGIYQKNSHVSHRILGMEELIVHKELIVDIYNEEFFYFLLGIVVQHHGEYGERPKSVYAKIIHMIDNLEAQCAGIDDELISEKNVITDVSGTYIKYRDESLYAYVQ